MNIDPGDQLAGLPILEIRRLLKWGSRCHDGWSPGLVQEVLDVSPYQARQVIKVLKQEGYIQKSQGWISKTYLENTLKGNALANASAARPLRRAAAEKKLAEFLDRVRHVRDSPEFLYKVKKVIVFGSYLSPKERLGDIDLALSLVSKVRDVDKRRKLEVEKSKSAQSMGRQFGTGSEFLDWPRHEVWLFLKGRSRSLSLHHIEEPILLMAECKVIYEDDEQVEVRHVTGGAFKSTG